jgi:hypothetical protein
MVVAFIQIQTHPNAIPFSNVGEPQSQAPMCHSSNALFLWFGAKSNKVVSEPLLVVACHLLLSAQLTELNPIHLIAPIFTIANLANHN